MKKIFTFLLFAFAVSWQLNAQTPGCGDTFYDDGGANGPYSSNLNQTITIYPDNAGDRVNVEFISFDMENYYDKMWVYNGPDDTFPVFSSGRSDDSWTGGPGDTYTANGQIFSSTHPSGALTFVFTSDSSVQHDGWEAVVTCDPLPSCLPPSSLSASNITTVSAELSWTPGGNETAWNVEYGPAGFTQGSGTTVAAGSNPFTLTGLTSATSYDFYVQADCGNGDVSSWVGPYNFITPPACGDTFYDDGGPSGSYSSGLNQTLTIYPDNAGDGVTVTFNSFDMEQGWDGMMVYNGPDTNAPLFDSGSTYGRTNCPNGAWTGAPGDTYTADGHSFTSTHSTGALTFVFTSDGFVQHDGWEAVITCAPLPSCLPPMFLTVSNITSDSAELSWTENGTATTWNVEYGPAGFTQGSGTTVAAGSNPFTLTGLTSSTSYDFYVQADCGSGDTSSWVGPVSFTTACDIVTTFPYNYGFENTTANIEGDWSNSCWSGNPENTNSDLLAGPFRWTPNDSGTPSGNTGPSGAHNGSMYAYTEASGSNDGDIAELISPIFDMTSLTQPQLSFYYHMYGADIGTLSVDTYDGSTWTNDVWTMSGEQQSSDSDPWLEGILTFANNVTQVRFRAVRGGGFKSDIAIDDILIQEAPSCPHPSFLSVGNITADSAELSWTENGTATTWNVEYGPAGFTQGSGTTVAAGSNPFTLTGLTSSTSYDFYVQADCGSGSVSPWSGPYTFMTPCTTINTFPYTQDFENGGNIPNCWVNDDTDAGGEWEFTTSNSHGPDADHTSGSGYYALLNDYSIHSYESPFNLITPTFDLSATAYIMKYWYWIGPDGADNPIHIDVSTDGGSNWTEDVFVHDNTTTTGEWAENLINLSAYNTSNVVIRFRGESIWGYSTDNSGIDDITIMEAPSCMYPSDLSASNITADSAELSWTPGGNETAWNVEYGPVGFTQGSGTTVAAGSNPFTLTGLTSSTSYDFYVQADCGNGDTSDWAGPYTFMTAGTCGFFKVDLLDSEGDGWSGGLLTIFKNGTVFMNLTLDNGAGPESHYIPVDINDILSFDYTAGSWSSENEYVIYDNNNMLLADEGAAGAEPGDIGDPSIPDGLQACPTCPKPTNLSVANIGPYTADLSWTENGSATAWNIEYGPAGFTPGQGTTIAVTTIPYTLTGLTEHTAYDFYVQSDCGSGDTSMWEGPFNFTTLCDPQLPYHQDFNTNDGCWTTEDANFDDITWTRGKGATPIACANDDDDYVMYARFNRTQDMDDWLFTPGFNLTAGTEYTILFSYGNDGTDTFEENMDVYISTGANSTDALNGTQILSETGIVDGCHNFVNYSVTVPTDGIYYVAFHGNSSANQDILMIDDFVLDTAANINELNNVTGIYPNPTTGEFVIKSHDLKNAKVFVYSMTGKEIYHGIIDNDTYTINLYNVKKGVYFVKITSSNKSHISKLIVK